MLHNIYQSIKYEMQNKTKEKNTYYLVVFITVLLWIESRPINIIDYYGQINKIVYLWPYKLKEILVLTVSFFMVEFYKTI
jgi:branched-subunit amino acid permease